MISIGRVSMSNRGLLLNVSTYAAAIKAKATSPKMDKSSPTETIFLPFHSAKTIENSETMSSVASGSYSTKCRCACWLVKCNKQLQQTSTKKRSCTLSIATSQKDALHKDYTVATPFASVASLKLQSIPCLAGMCSALHASRYTVTTAVRTTSRLMNAHWNEARTQPGESK